MTDPLSPRERLTAAMNLLESSRQTLLDAWSLDPDFDEDPEFKIRIATAIEQDRHALNLLLSFGKDRPLSAGHTT